jgi:hypothetical protein
MNDIELNKKLINLMESSMSEAAKPDYIDLDKDGDKKETMKKAAKDKKKVDEAEHKDGKMPSKSHIMKMCKDGKSKKEICDMHPDCDQKELKDMIDDCKEKTDESLSALKSSLREKMEEVMEAGRYAAPASKGQNPDATTSSMPAKSAPVLDNEGVNGYRGKLVGEEEETDEEVLDEADLDEMAEMMRMAGLSEDPHATTSSMPRNSPPTKGSEQVNGYRDYMVGEAEDDAERDDHAEKAGREVARDMEYDDGHDASDDDHDEKEGRHVAKDIEFDEKEHEAMKSILQKLMK